LNASALDLPVPIFFAESCGLWENEDDAGVPAREEERDDADKEDLSRKDADEDSRSLDGTFDCECEGE
jgi:hypothetical protein